MLQVIKNQTMLLDPREVRVVLSSTDSEELTTRIAKDYALQIADTLGPGPWGLSSWDGPYPVTKEGKAIENADDMVRIRQEMVVLNENPVYYNGFRIIRRGF